jgi:hypothetical protein
MAASCKRRFITTICLTPCFLFLVSANLIIANMARQPILPVQRSFPAVPDDLTRVYYQDAQNRLVPLPFESAMTSLNPYAVAQKDRISYAELKGSKATTILGTNDPRFYVFIGDRMDPPPHQLVRLMSARGIRRFTIVSVKGRVGYSPMDDESIKLEYRLLERLRVEAGKGRYLFINYMETHPRHQLIPGEYAIIGDSLLDIATFRIQ